MIIPIGLAPRSRLYKLERDDKRAAWRAWIAMSSTGYGTYLLLYDGGAIERVTLREDIPEERDWIKRAGDYGDPR